MGGLLDRRAVRVVTSSARPRGESKRISIPVYPMTVLGVLALLAALWTLRLYRPAPEVYFPKRAQDFRSPSARDAARAAAQAALQQDPESIGAWMDLAVVSFESGPDEYVKGLEAAERARELGALDPRVFYYAARMYEAKGLPDYAVADYERYLRHAPDDDDTRLQLANLYARAGGEEKAIIHYRRLLAQRPDDPVLAFNLAVVYRELERWQDGIILLESIVSKGLPLPDGAGRMLGDLHRGMGNDQQALSYYLKEYTRVQNDPDLEKSIALTYEGMKDYASALPHWVRAHELNPKDKKARAQVFLLKRKLKM
jgi:tetratricopeptide (TPR) repeat protein